MANCNQQNTDIGAPSSSGTNSVTVSTPHVTQVRVPRRDDGKWLSVASMVGALVGKWANSDLIDKAKAAEDKWEDYTDLIGDAGVEEFTTHAQAIRACDDQLWEKYCAYAMCGYKPDYTGILTRARADVALIGAGKRAEICRTADRYNVGINSNVMCDLLRTETLALVGATTTARENERQMMWKFNAEYLASAASRFEQAYQGRIRLGGDLIASAGQNYAFLAESLRRTAEKSVGDFAAMGAIIAVLVTTFLDKGCPSDTDCGCDDGGGGGP